MKAPSQSTIHKKITLYSSIRSTFIFYSLATPRIHTKIDLQTQKLQIK